MPLRQGIVRRHTQLLRSLSPTHPLRSPADPHTCPSEQTPHHLVPVHVPFGSLPDSGTLPPYQSSDYPPHNIRTRREPLVLVLPPLPSDRPYTDPARRRDSRMQPRPQAPSLRTRKTSVHGRSLRRPPTPPYPSGSALRARRSPTDASHNICETHRHTPLSSLQRPSPAHL